MRLSGSIGRLLNGRGDNRARIPVRRMRMVPAALVGAQVLHLGGGEQISCPGAQLLPMGDEALELGLGYPSLALPPAQMFVLNDAVVCPGSRVVLSGDGRLIAESLSADMVGEMDVLASEVRGAPVRMDGAIALYQSPRTEPFHSLIDHLPRAALFAQPLVRRLGNVTLVHDGPLTDIDELWLSKLAGPSVKVLRSEPGTPLSAERVFLPSYVTRPQSGAVPSWYRRWIDKAISAVPQVQANPFGVRRYFVDRLGGGRMVRNRAELLEVFDRHLVTPVAPSALDVEERIATFRDAELVIGVTGSGMSNLIFSRAAQVVELLPGARLFPHSYYLCRSKGLAHEYIKAPADGRDLSEVDRLLEDVVVDVNALDQLLGRLLENGEVPPGSTSVVA